MTWFLIGAAAWCAAALVTALGLGRAIRLGQQAPAPPGQDRPDQQ